MIATVKSWLAAQITNIDSVQKCVLDQGADIVVHSWRGVLIHVHLLDEAPKPRQLKKQVQEATRTGIGSLFVVSAGLLPPDGATVIPADWMLALHALTEEKIYSYRLTDSGPRIGQVHLRMTNKSEEREVWYGPDIEIGQLPFFRIWIKTAILKGDFLVANFAAPPFWHNRDYRSARAAENAQRTAQAQRVQYEFGYGSGPSHGFTRTQTALERSYARLGLTSNASCDEVKTAFRRLALESHPDVSALPKQEAEIRFRELSEAYNFIREQGGCD